MSSAHLSLLIFLLAILNPACASSSPAFLMMYSAYKLYKQGDNIQPYRKIKLTLHSDFGHIEMRSWRQRLCSTCHHQWVSGSVPRRRGEEKTPEATVLSQGSGSLSLVLGKLLEKPWPEARHDKEKEKLVEEQAGTAKGKSGSRSCQVTPRPSTHCPWPRMGSCWRTASPRPQPPG